MMLKKITCFIMSCFLLSTLSLAIEFSDMENHWAKEAVDEMASREIIKGYSDGTFKPNRQVTREEFATILVKALHLEENSSATQGIIIEDVNENRWSTPYIKTVWPYITKYKVKDKIYFYPAVASTREDMAVAIVKALLAKFPTNSKYDISKYSDNSEKLEADLSQFKDKNKISKNLKPYVAVAKNTGIINGYEDGTFRPDGKLTRAATASLMWNLLKALGEEKVVDPIIPTLKNIYGDINGDEQVSADDASLLFNYSMLPEQYASKVIAEVNIYGDVDKNGVLDIRDSEIIQKYVEGIIYNLPHEHEMINGQCVCGEGKEEILYGDVYLNDGGLTMADATQIERYVTGKSHVDFDLRIADVNIDGIVDMYDAYLVQATLSGKIDKLPHECKINIKGYEKINEEEHNKIAECQCGDFSIKTSEAHNFVNGKCVCGAEEEEEILYGDVNGDSKITAVDCALVAAASSGKYELGEYKKAADVNLDGEITVEDGLLIQKYSLGKIPTLPHQCNFNIDGECACGAVEEKILYGDANGDGLVNMDDVTYIEKYINGTTIELVEKNADVFIDGQIDKFDRTLLLKYVAKITSKLPHTCGGFKEINLTQSSKNPSVHDISYICMCKELTYEERTFEFNEPHNFVNGKCECGALEITNSAPVISSVTTSDIKTDSFIIKATATNNDNDSLTYLVYVSKNGNFELLKTSNPIASGKEFSYTVTGLNNYTDYSYYIEVNDGTTSTKSETYTQKTLCPGGTKFEVWCTGGSSKCSYDCTYTTCGKCSHGVHSGTCTVVTCTSCNGTGKCPVGSKPELLKTTLDTYIYCDTCMKASIHAQEYHCNGCGNDGHSYKCQTCSYWNYTSVHDTNPNCAQCNGKPTCGCTHNSMYCNKSSYTCSHGYVGGHYYSSTSQCSHGYTSQH